MPSSAPRVSVVVRSLDRLMALAELLERLLQQEHDSFEVVVVEQTVKSAPEDLDRVARLAEDPRVRLLRRPPLGGPAARNEGVSAARGEIVVLIDDDDLPVSRDWVAAHERHYDDPSLVGLTARHVRSLGERCPYALRSWVRRRCMSYSFLKTPYTYARFDEDVDGVQWLHGTNASFRRELIERVGLWDTTVRSQDEHSFAFRLHLAMRPGEYLAFRSYPPVLRRLDISGGMKKRWTDARGELTNHLRFAHQIVGRYHPARYRIGYPLYLGWAEARALRWVWDRARDPTPLARRVLQSLHTVGLLPRVARDIRRELPSGRAGPDEPERGP